MGTNEDVLGKTGKVKHLISGNSRKRHSATVMAVVYNAVSICLFHATPPGDCLSSNFWVLARESVIVDHSGGSMYGSSFCGLVIIRCSFG